MTENRTPLLTDRYELTMLTSLIESGHAERAATFELFARKLPEGRRFGIVAGLGRFLDALPHFRFDADHLTWLTAHGVITPAVANYLTNWQFTGTIDAYPEGSLYWPGSPVMTVTGTLGDGIVLETLALSIFNHDSAVASAAARMVTAAHGRPIIEMGSRRVHEEAAVAAARAAYVAGFASTSNLAAGYTYEIPTVGTAAHAFTLAHDTEPDAFTTQIATHGPGTTLLVDTYDTTQGIRNAVAAAQAVGATGPGAIRLDSGDLLVEARNARDLLDVLGATDTKITVTSDLDEYLITELAAAPIDGYGAGTRVATGSGHPTAGMVYKLVARADTTDPDAPQRPVAKKASGKASIGGRKTAYRYPDGTERFTIDGTIPAGAAPVQVRVVTDGTVVHNPTLDQIRAHTAAQLATLPAEATQVSHGTAYRTATLEPTHTPTLTTQEDTMNKTALIIVDVQNDFTEGGALAVTGGNTVAARVTRHLDQHDKDYALIVATRDWHDPTGSNGGHFAAPGTDPDYVDTWPAHCVAGTTGADYHPDLDTSGVDVHIVKGMGEPAYSGFEGVTDTADGEPARTLIDVLTENGITHVHVVGIATDYCVRATALHAAGHGLDTTVLADMTAPVLPATLDTLWAELSNAGVTVTGTPVTTSDDQAGAA